MKNIKFRAWSEDTCEMVQVVRLDIKEETIHYENGIKSINREQELGFWWKPYVLMQYTGLDDKNGLGIFEKDIVKVESTDGLEYVCFVDWCEREREYAVFLKGEPWRRLSIEDEIEVIGNVYQNKGLLEVRE